MPLFFLYYLAQSKLFRYSENFEELKKYCVHLETSSFVTLALSFIQEIFVGCFHVLHTIYNCERFISIQKKNAALVELMF